MTSLIQVSKSCSSFHSDQNIPNILIYFLHTYITFLFYSFICLLFVQLLHFQSQTYSNIHFVSSIVSKSYIVFIISEIIATRKGCKSNNESENNVWLIIFNLGLILLPVYYRLFHAYLMIACLKCVVVFQTADQKVLNFNFCVSVTIKLNDQFV